MGGRVVHGQSAVMAFIRCSHTVRFLRLNNFVVGFAGELTPPDPACSRLASDEPSGVVFRARRRQQCNPLVCSWRSLDDY